MKSILTFGAIADGKSDCSPFIKKAFDECLEVYFPEGIYLITEPVKIPSNHHVLLDKNATIFACDGCFNKAGIRAVVTNSDYVNGNQNIVFEGGKIDANSKGNSRESWRDGPNSGLSVCFQNVNNLTLKSFTVHNSEAYNVRITKVNNFVIENLTFTADYYPHCQDGIHVSGLSNNGIIRNVTALGKCSNDDLIAFNADDVNYYCHNWGQENGPISNMLVENVSAENCWTALRLLSIDNQISNVTVRNVMAGIRCHAINLDAARYCADPIFTDDQKPNGVGNLKNITLENFTLYKSEPDMDTPFCIFETKGNIAIKNLKRDYSKDTRPDIPTVRIKNLPNHEITVNDTSYTSQGELQTFDGDKFDIVIRS